MFFSWLKGIIGSVIGWVGLVIFLVLMWANISKEDSDWSSSMIFWIVISIIMMIVGSYMKYVSRQTVKKSK